MTQDKISTTPIQSQRTIVARHIGAYAVQTTIGAGLEQRGPWSFVTGIPNSHSDMVGPPPQYLAVAAWAA